MLHITKSGSGPPRGTFIAPARFVCLWLMERSEGPRAVLDYIHVGMQCATGYTTGPIAYGTNAPQSPVPASSTPAPCARPRRLRPLRH